MKERYASHAFSLRKDFFPVFPLALVIESDVPMKKDFSPKAPRRFLGTERFAIHSHDGWKILFLGQEHHLINCVNTMPPTPSLPLPYGMEEDYAAVNLPRTDVHAPVPGCSMKLLFR